MDFDRDRLEKALRDNRRVTIEAPVAVVEDGRGLIAGYESLLTSDKAHLTVLHIGRLADLDGELSGFRAPVGNGGLLDDFGRFVKELKAAPTYRATALSIENLRVGESGVRVLRLEPSADLARFRRETRAGFLHTIERLGVADAETFMARSRTVAQYSPNWLPHITLRAVHTRDANRRQMADVRVTFAMPRLRY